MSLFSVLTVRHPVVMAPRPVSGLQPSRPALSTVHTTDKHGKANIVPFSVCRSVGLSSSTLPLKFPVLVQQQQNQDTSTPVTPKSLVLTALFRTSLQKSKMTYTASRSTIQAKNATEAGIAPPIISQTQDGLQLAPVLTVFDYHPITPDRTTVDPPFHYARGTVLSFQME